MNLRASSSTGARMPIGLRTFLARAHASTKTAWMSGSRFPPMRRRQVRRPDEDAVDALHGRDRLELIEGLLRLHLGKHADLLVGVLEVVGDLAEAARPVAHRHAAD